MKKILAADRILRGTASGALKCVNKILQHPPEEKFLMPRNEGPVIQKMLGEGAGGWSSESIRNMQGIFKPSASPLHSNGLMFPPSLCRCLCLPKFEESDLTTNKVI